MVYQNATSCNKKRGNHEISAVKMPGVSDKILNWQHLDKFADSQAFVSARYTSVGEVEVDQAIAKAATQLRTRIAIW